LHRYACKIGWPVPLLEQIMTMDDIREAMAYAKLEPWHEERADLRAGIIASVIANANRSSGSKAFKASDFMPKYSQDEPDNKPLVDKIKKVLISGNSG